MRHTPEQQALADNEWDFRALPSGERQACLYYEYARESGALLADLTIWLRHYPSDAPWPTEEDSDDWKERYPADAPALRRFYRSPACIASAIEGFPQVPWLDIPSSERSRAMVRVRWHEIEHRLNDMKRETRHRSLAKFSFDSFRVSDWGRTNTELVKEFREWLNKTRRADPDLAKRGRHQNPHDLLRHLGALRLSRHAARVRGSTRRVIETKIDARNLSRDANKAVTFIKKFYK